MTFGVMIVVARGQAHISLRELAAQIKKDDGEPLSQRHRA